MTGRGGTEAESYAMRLERLQGAWWKRLLPVQLPYRWNLRRQHLGRTLDVGCGLGRNLMHLPAGSVGVDHNQRAVQVTRDLTSFWDRTYAEVRKELFRRYPRHKWPEDPRALFKDEED